MNHYMTTVYVYQIVVRDKNHLSIWKFGVNKETARTYSIKVTSDRFFIPWNESNNVYTVLIPSSDFSTEKHKKEEESEESEDQWCI